MKKKITFSILLSFITATVFAGGSYVKKVIIVNEGHYDYTNSLQTVPVTVGAYDPATRTYAVFDTIKEARFASHVIVEGSDIFVAADTMIVRYNADTYQRIASTSVHGVRKLAVWGDELLLSRGEYGVTYDSYFQVFSKNDLQFLYDLPVAIGPQYATESIIVKDNIAYVAVGNGFDYGNEKGLVGRVDLANHNYINEINLGAGGTNPEGMFIDRDENIYTVNNTNYSTASVSKVSLSAQSAVTTNLALTSGCGASGFAPGFVLFQGSYGSLDHQIGRFNTSTLAVQDTLPINKNIYGMATDTVNNLIYVGETDYLSYGKIFIYDFTGAVKDSFDVSVSPGNIAMDIRTSPLAVAESGKAHSFTCYPNPAHDEVLVVSSVNGKKNTYVLTDITGREVARVNTVMDRFSIDMHTFDAGVYLLRSLNNNDQIKIVKQ